MSILKSQDPELKNMIDLELNRQRNKLEMIASEKLRIRSGYGSTGQCIDQ